MDNTSGDFPCNKMDTRKQLPLTPSQQGFLFHSLKDKKRSNYHEHFTCIFSQHVDSATSSGRWKRYFESMSVFALIITGRLMSALVRW